MDPAHLSVPREGEGRGGEEGSGWGQKGQPLTHTQPGLLGD